MDAARLLALLEVLDAEMKGGYEQALGKLQNLHTQAQENPQQDNSEAIQQKYEELVALLAASRVNDFVPSRLHTMERIGAADLFGESALAAIDRAMSARGGIAAVVRELSAFRSRLNEFSQHAANIRSGLQGLGVEPALLRKGEYELGLIFPLSLTDGQLPGLNRALEDWNFILRTFAQVAGDETPEIEIRDVASGSTLVGCFFNISINDVAVWLPALDRIAALYTKIRKIRDHRTELEKLDVSFSMPDALIAKEHEERLLMDGLYQIRENLFLQGDVKVDAGRKAELKTQLTKALRALADYIDHDVDVEISLPDQLPEPKVDKKELVDESGEALTGDALAQRKKELVAEKQRKMRAAAAAVAGLPARDEPILQLTEREEEEGGGEKHKEGSRKKAQGQAKSKKQK
ncbi:MAG: hypothetical protein PVJ64_05090 [Gemmatimonadales bacterium]|jgi:hypothetical protein